MEGTRVRGEESKREEMRLHANVKKNSGIKDRTVKRDNLLYV